MADTPTADPTIVIEQKRQNYVRYRRLTDGRRWEVRGTCDRRGDCLVGALIGGTRVRDKAHLTQLQAQLGKARIDSEEDVPVTPEFTSCCGADRFTYTELAPQP